MSSVAELTVFFWNVRLRRKNKTTSIPGDVLVCIWSYVLDYKVNLIILAEATPDFAEMLLSSLNKGKEGPWRLQPLNPQISPPLEQRGSTPSEKTFNLKEEQVSRAGVMLWHTDVGEVTKFSWDVDDPKLGIEWIYTHDEHLLPRGRILFLPDHQLLVAGVHLLSQFNNHPLRLYLESHDVGRAIRSTQGLFQHLLEGRSVGCLIIGDFNQHPFELSIVKGFGSSHLDTSDQYYNPFAGLWGDKTESGQIKGTYYYRPDKYWWLLDYALCSLEVANRLDKSFLTEDYPKAIQPHFHPEGLWPSDHAPVMIRIHSPGSAN